MSASAPAPQDPVRQSVSLHGEPQGTIQSAQAKLKRTSQSGFHCATRIITAEALVPEWRTSSTTNMCWPGEKPSGGSKLSCAALSSAVAVLVLDHVRGAFKRSVRSIAAGFFRK
jgi:hypothetical protein